MKKELGISILLLVLCAVTTAINPGFISLFNVSNLCNQIGMYGIFSIGLGLVIITGGIDLSVGSMFALTGALLAEALTKWHWPWPLAVLFVLALPMVAGLVHGLLITRMRIQPFVITLCGLMIYRGLARYISDDSSEGFGAKTGFEGFAAIAGGKILGVPTPFVLLVIIAVIMWFVLHRSVYGRYLYAVGRNEEAARFSGINTRRVITSSYVIAGLLTGISGILIAFYTNAITPSTHGNAFELYGIAGAVLGGCSMRGGEGSILGIVIGTALLKVLENLVNLAGITSSLNYTVIGTVLLVGVLADEILKRRAQKKLVKH